MNRLLRAFATAVHPVLPQWFACAAVALAVTAAAGPNVAVAQDGAPQAKATADAPYVQHEIKIPSSRDKSLQAARLDVPKSYNPDGAPVPLVVLLHSWSADYKQGNSTLERMAGQAGWLLVMPNFRGPNRVPSALGSPLAQQDILDAVDWVVERYRVDQSRIYLCGVSGGGHMTMLMAGKYPKRWRAASAWVGISDVASWHTLHENDRYGQNMRDACGGRPGDSPEVDAQYRARSPLTYLANVGDLPLDLGHGIHDGHTGSVPIRHSLDAFNAVVKGHVSAGQPDVTITEEEIQQLSQRNGRLKAPKEGDELLDAAWGRQIYLRRQSGNTRVSIFEGGHEGIAAAMMDWFMKHGGKEVKE